MTDWPTKIVELMRLKERIASLDVDRLFPYTLSAVAANGWQAFFETQDLLSTEQLTAGRHRDAFAAWIRSAPAQAAAAGFSSETLLPIAVDLEMPLFAAMPVIEGRVASRVLSMDPSGIIDDFDSFDAYFDSTLAYTRRNLADFESGAYRI